MRRGVIEGESDEHWCIVCGELARVDVTVCSRPCLLEARRELDANVALIHQISDEETRGELMARNAHLSAAMISWSP